MPILGKTLSYTWDVEVRKQTNTPRILHRRAHSFCDYYVVCGARCAVARKQNADGVHMPYATKPHDVTSRRMRTHMQANAQNHQKSRQRA